jgi:hypothetical protein
MNTGQELNLSAGKSVSFGDGNVVEVCCLFNSPFMGLTGATKTIRMTDFGRD